MSRMTVDEAVRPWVYIGLTMMVAGLILLAARLVG